MTIKEFFELYPIDPEKFAKMLGRGKKYIANKNYGTSRWNDQDVQFMNEAIQELSYQLSLTQVHGELIYQAKCLKCGRPFTAQDEGDRHEFYNTNGLTCDECIERSKTRRFYLYEDDPDWLKIIKANAKKRSLK
jgi:DNA-directed RNA polymerase subunit RPC12/RpoP